MRKVSVILMGIVLFLPLSVSLAHFPLKGVRFDVLWLLSLYVAFLAPLPWGAFFMLGFALLQESLGTSSHGLLVLPYWACYLLLRVGRTRLFFEGVEVQCVWVFILTVVRKLLELWLLHHQGWGNFPFYMIFVDALLQSMTAFFLFPLIDVWFWGRRHA